MPISAAPYILALLLTAAVTGVLAVVAVRRHLAAGASGLSSLMIGVAVWSAAYAFELGSLDVGQAVLAAKVEYIGIVSVPVSWLIFALGYTGTVRGLSRRAILALAAIPATTLALAWTNELHNLLWTSIALEQQRGMLLMVVRYGPWFWVHTLYSYGCLVVGTVTLLRWLMRSRHLYRGQALAMVASSVAPWIGNALYLLRIGSWQGIDLTPFGFAATGLLTAWSLFRLRLFDVVPIARDVVIESMADAVVVLDESDRVVDINPAALRLIGRSAAAVIGQPAPEVLSNEVGIDSWRNGVQDGSWELPLTVGGRPLVLDVQISSISRKDGRRIGRLVVARDISVLKAAEAQLLVAKDAAETASRAKSAFLGHVSHELRTPLTAILGYTDLLRIDLDAAANPAAAADLDAITTAGKHLLGMVSNLIDITALESEAVRLYPVAFDVAGLTSEVMELVRPRARQRGNSMALMVGEGVGEMVADPARVRQVLANVLGNAAQYTHDGAISCELERREADGRQWVEWRITDTGVGIPSSDVPRLFTAFGRAEPASSLAPGGPGLGLAISQRFCQLMGGSISVSSTPGEGSTFVILLPTGLPDQP